MHNQQAEIVKLQILNLGAKLLLTNPAQTKELFKYVLELAKYDLNYDVRDKARVMRGILFTSSTPTLAQHAQRLFITVKPTPSISTGSDDSQTSQYALGSLSHIVEHKAFGYLVRSSALLLPFAKECISLLRSFSALLCCSQSPTSRLRRPTPTARRRTPSSP